MSDKSKIEWTDATWNPLRGCSRVSEGCRNCYAERIAARFSGRGLPYEGVAVHHNLQADLKVIPHWTGEIRFMPETLCHPLRWRKPRRIFVCSMSDLFHEKVQPGWLAQIFGVMLRCPQHTFQVLTKRPENMKRFMDSARRVMGKRDMAEGLGQFGIHFPPPNVWLGVSVEDQKTADERIPLLLSTPAAVRWVSYEPALGPVDFSKIIARHAPPLADLEVTINSLWCVVPPHLNWIVCGGESGPGARPMHPDWARAARDQCQAADVPFFFKQWGEWIPVDQYHNEHALACSLYRGQDWNGMKLLRVPKKRAGRLLDGHEWNEFPRVTDHESRFTSI